MRCVVTSGRLTHYPKQPGQDADAHRKLAQANLDLLIKIERLDQQLVDLRADLGTARMQYEELHKQREALRAEGMEAAAKIVEGMAEPSDSPGHVGFVKRAAAALRSTGESA